MSLVNIDVPHPVPSCEDGQTRYKKVNRPKMIHKNYELSDSRAKSNSSFYKMKNQKVKNHKDILKTKGVKLRNKTYNHNYSSNKDIYFPYLDAKKTVDQHARNAHDNSGIPYSHVGSVL